MAASGRKIPSWFNHVVKKRSAKTYNINTLLYLQYHFIILPHAILSSILCVVSELCLYLNLRYLYFYILIVRRSVSFRSFMIAFMAGYFSQEYGNFKDMCGQKALHSLIIYVFSAKNSARSVFGRSKKSPCVGC